MLLFASSFITEKKEEEKKTITRNKKYLHGVLPACNTAPIEHEVLSYPLSLTLT